MLHRSLLCILGPTCVMLGILAASSCMDNHLTPNQVREKHIYFQDTFSSTRYLFGEPQWSHKGIERTSGHAWRRNVRALYHGAGWPDDLSCAHLALKSEGPVRQISPVWEPI